MKLGLESPAEKAERLLQVAACVTRREACDRAGVGGFGPQTAMAHSSPLPKVTTAWGREGLL